MTTVQTPSVSPALNTNATQTGGAGSPAAATSPPPVASGLPAGRSYANATKKSGTPPAVASSTSAPSVTSGAAQAASNAPVVVNGKPAMPTGNGASGSADHSKKPSVTISAAGASGTIPNGGPVVSPPAARPNINFGSMPTGSSPPTATNVPFQNQANALATPMANPRVTSPAGSPSPIPQPAASGGRPPSGFQPAQGNGLNFGSMPGENMNPQMRGMVPMQPGPQAAHLRRDSSQSSHSELGPQMAPSPGMMNRPGFMPPAGRGGRSYSGQGFPQQMPFSPAQNYRPNPNQNRGGPGMPQQFQNQMGMQQYPGSPNPPPRSPALPGSHPATPQMGQAHMANQQQQMQQMAQYQPQYANYMNQQGQFGMQQQYDPNYPYYQMPYQMPQYMQGAGAPQSPGQFKRFASQQHGQYGPSQYNPPPPSNMSRTSSQLSERPASTVGQATAPPPPSSTGTPSHAPSQSIGTAPSSNFVLPKKSKGITITNPDGEVLTFDKKTSPARSATPAKTASPAPSATAASLAPPPSASPAIASNPTSPPKSGTPDILHARTESKATKSDAETKAAFQEQVRKQLEDEKRRKDEAEGKASKEKEEADAKFAKEKADEAAAIAKQKEEAAAAEKAKAEAEAAAAAAAATAAAATAAEDEAARKKREEDEEFERQVAEMEAELAAKEKAEEEREAAYQAKKKAEAEAKKAKEKEEAELADEDMKRLEREAEAAEEEREAERNEEKSKEDETDEAKADRDLFMSLKKPTLGPGAGLSSPSGTATPVSDDSMAPPPQKTPTSGKPKPAMLKLETVKPVEPAQPTPGMQSLKSARFLELQRESVNYPEGIKSPNPALNQGGKRNGRLYDVAFLRQFQDAFKEKPSLDWDQRLKDTVGDPNDSSQPKSARTPGSGVGSRQPSRHGAIPPAFQGMGNFSQSGRTLPPGTSSMDRFNASSGFGGQRAPTMTNPMAGFANRPGAFPMGAQSMSRSGSVQNLPGNSPRQGSQRGKQASRGRDGRQSKKEEEQANRAMPLTAGSDLKPLELSTSGWKPTSLTNPAASSTLPNGHMAPDMVQRKVKAALNKMTPERFDKLADEILKIAGQSKDETDGRTLRQVIALTFEKACDEAHWASMYAKFCKRMLEEMSPDIKDEAIRDKNDKLVTGGPLFRKYLLNRCQEEFERGWEADLPDKPEGQDEAVMLSDEYYIAAAAKRKGLGLIQFIGELYKLGMLSIRIMHECVMRLLNFTGTPDESAIESLVKLLRTVGSTMDSSEQGPGLISSYFDRIATIMNMPNLPSRMHFMLLDTVDLRKSGWNDKNDAKGPKTIQEIREQAALAQQQADLERARQNQRGGGGRLPQGRGDARNFSGGPMPPPDYPKNQVGMDDLRRLGNRVNSRQTSQGPSSLGPTSMLSSRSGSGRAGSQLGPGGMLRNDSANTSRTGTPPIQPKKDENATNAFSALASLDPSGEETGGTPATSPSMTNVKPVAATESSPAKEATPAPEASATGEASKTNE